MSQFKKQAKAAGFTDEQADFMDRYLAKFPHDHTIAQIEGLEEELNAIADAADDSDDEDDYE